MFSEPLGAQTFLTGTLVLSRLAGLLAAAPALAGRETPLRVRAALLVALTLVIAPLQCGAAARLPATASGYLGALACELLLGAALGLSVAVLLGAMQLAGQLVSQAGGLSLAELYSADAQGNIPLLSHALHWVALAVFVGMGGHRLVVEGLLQTFAAVPPGQGGISGSLAEGLKLLVGEGLKLSLRAAAPLVTALLAAHLVLALASRTLPQLGGLGLGLGASAVVTLAMLWSSLGTQAWLFEAQVQPFLQTMIEAISAPPDPAGSTLRGPP